MTKAIIVRVNGGPEVLKLEEISLRAPGAGEIKLRHHAIGVNFIDTYFRSGLYKAAPAVGLPPGVFIPGQEGVGIVEDIGAGVTDLRIGDRVAYGNGPTGGYAEQRIIPAASVIKVPLDITDNQIAGVMQRGLTVWYLIRALHVLRPGETVLFHAAAGGVGLIFCQWARHIGATVIGTVGSEEKAEAAKAAGCHHTILYRQEDWVARVRELTNGEGVRVVYDGVGKDTFFGSLDCLSRLGLMCSFGNASGPAPAVEPAMLLAKGSLFLTRPRLMDYIARREDYARAATELFEVLSQGIVKAETKQSYALADARHAHNDLESRKTTGPTVLLP